MSDPQILELVQGYQIPFSSEPKQMKPPNPVHLTIRGESQLDLKIQVVLKKCAIPMVEKSQYEFLSRIILAEK